MKTQRMAPNKYWLWAYQKVIFSYIPLMAVKELLENQSQESAWQYVAKTFNWEEVSEVFLRAIALKIYNLEYGHLILLPILKLKALRFEDLEMMANNWANPNKIVQWEVIIAAYEAAPKDWINKKTHMTSLSSKIQPIPSACSNAMDYHDENLDCHWRRDDGQYR